MQTLNYWEVAPKAVQPLLQSETYLKSQLSENGLNPLLIELVKIRVSQINQCAYCLDMHTKDALALGETEQRIIGLSAWREAPFYSSEERAALKWTEALTLLADKAPDQALRNELLSHFDEKSVVDLTLAICTINSWNRFAHAFGADVGSYQVGQFG